MDRFSKRIGRHLCGPTEVWTKITLHVGIWNLPEEGWLKCNTDGAYRGNPGQSCYAFCIRNTQGNILYAEAKRLGQMTNMEAKIKAILHGLIYFSRKEKDNIIVETGSLVLQKIILKEWKITLHIREDIEKIHQVAATRNILITHIYRESN